MTGQRNRCGCASCFRAERKGMKTPAPDCLFGRHRSYGGQAPSRCGTYNPVSEKARNFMDPGAGPQVDGGDGLVSIVTTGLRGMGIAPRTAAAAQPPTAPAPAAAAAAAAAAPAPSRSAFEYMTVNQAVKEGYMYPPEESWDSDEAASGSDEEGLPRKVYVAAYKNGPLRSKTRDSWESDEIASDSDEEGLPKKVYSPAYKNGPLRSKTRWGRRNGKPYYPDWYTQSEYEPVDVPCTEDAEIQEGEQGEEPNEDRQKPRGGTDGDDNDNMDADYMPRAILTMTVGEDRQSNPSTPSFSEFS